MNATILLVEDDRVIVQTIATYLKQWGEQPVIATAFNDLMSTFHQTAPQLVIMDINLPFYNGFHWLELIRRESKVPVLFLTSAGDDMNLVMAMNMGADDFLAKPIELPVLMAKVQGLLRRTYEYQTVSTTYQQGDYQLVPGDNELHTPTTTVTLTPSETKLLTLLFAQAGAVVTREAMIEKLWEGDDYIDRNALAVTINRLRKKVAAVGLDTAIQTVKGHGYRLEVN